MKKIFSLLMFVCLFMVSACSCKKDDINFAYFSDKVSNVSGYSYYSVSEVIKRDELVLYENKKDVYFYNNMQKICVNNKQLNDIESEELYSVNSSEYYFLDSTLYYLENDEWKSKEYNDANSSVSFSFNEEVFDNYVIKVVDGNKIFDGKLKNDSLNSFFNVELENVSDVNVNVTISSSDLVSLVKFSYISSEGNNIEVILNFNYSYVLEFSLPF